MCGICGFVVENKKQAIELADVLRKMTNVLVHRGPDSDGYYSTDTNNLIIDRTIGSSN